MARLEQRHFEFIAQTLAELRLADDGQHFYICEHFAEALKTTNPRFKEQLFLDRCRGVKPAPRRRKRRLSLEGHIWSKELDIDNG